MPVPAMAEPAIDHQRRFQAAVDVIQNLPKNGSYRPSYEVMLRFYSLYKQAVCGPCTLPRPAFWDPVGRYKWDAWSRLGEMSQESAMEAYVDEMKKVAQEVIDNVPVNEKTALLLHHFEPLYLVIDDMPRPPESLVSLREGLEGSDEVSDGHAPMTNEETDQVTQEPREGASQTSCSLPDDSGVCDGLFVTSDSESEVFCDSVDSVEELVSVKMPVFKSNGLQNGHSSLESPLLELRHLEGRLEVRQVGAGQGGEGGEDGKGHGPHRTQRGAPRQSSHPNWRERGAPHGGLRQGVAGDAGGAGRGGGDGSEGGVERLQDGQLQQQIILALRRLREDMRSVMDRLEVVERLAATHVQGSEWTRCLRCAAKQQEESWWPFDVSGQTMVLFLLWPFVAQGVVHLLKKAHEKKRLAP
ncbi:acyl-CoA-binding domain-containing protein 4 [Neosynchiropus ocellatus]